MILSWSLANPLKVATDPWNGPGNCSLWDHARLLQSRADLSEIPEGLRPSEAFLAIAPMYAISAPWRGLIMMFFDDLSTWKRAEIYGRSDRSAEVLKRAHRLVPSRWGAGPLTFLSGM